ncbi:unnamed protein product, partial [Heterosigma akashiwo]
MQSTPNSQEEGPAEHFQRVGDLRDRLRDTLKPEPPLRFSAHNLYHGPGLVEDDEASFMNIPTGVLFCPFADTSSTGVETIERKPILCLGCAAYVNPYVNIDSPTGNWECTFCNYLNPCYSSELIECDEEGFKQFPELSHKVVEYTDDLVHSDPSDIIPLATGPHRQREHQHVPALIFVIDGTAVDDNMEELKESILSALTAADGNSAIGLIVFSSVVKIYRLGLNDLIVADTFPGTEFGAADEKKLEQNAQEYLVHMDSGIDSIIDALTSLQG